MLFNSIEFFIFLFIVIVVYYIIPNEIYKQIFLILSGAFFLLQSNILSITIISFIAVLNFFLGIEIEKKKDNKVGQLLFLIAILINIGNLFFFKYYNFFNENLNIALEYFGFNSPFPFLNILLPLGISFYTFSVLGYLIEIKIGKNNAEKNFVFFLNYVFFFTKLLAGPIEKSQNFLPQCRENKSILWENFSVGSKLIIWGFFQKLVIADRISIFVDTIYGSVEMHSGITIFFYISLYTLQIYADFSGYTDIARGIAKIFGYNLMENFKRPLLANSITEFWRRWHISLSSWVNDYIYTPISLKLRNIGVYGIIIALFISFLIVGIWHGAIWTFIFFGIFQGVILTYEFLTLKFRKKIYYRLSKRLINIIGIFLTFLVLTFSLVLFRAPNIETALKIYNKISFNGDFVFVGNIGMIASAIVGIVILISRDIIIEYFKKDIFVLRSNFFIIRSFPYAILIILILMFGVFDGGQFIYFKY